MPHRWPRRVRHVEHRRGAARRPRSDGLLPGWRRAAVRSRAAPAGRRRRSWTVRGARKAGGEIVHELEPDGGEPPAVGDELQVDLDWARRFALMRTHTALHALCGVVWRDHGALVTGGNMEPGWGRMDFEFETMSRRPRRRDRGDRQRGAGGRTRGPRQRPAARRGVRHPRPHPDQGQPAARGHRGDPDDRDRRARPAGRRWHARREHARGRRHQGDRLRVEGPDQQAHPHRAGRAGAAARVGCGLGGAGISGSRARRTARTALVVGDLREGQRRRSRRPRGGLRMSGVLAGGPKRSCRGRSGARAPSRSPDKMERPRGSGSGRSPSGPLVT